MVLNVTLFQRHVLDIKILRSDIPGPIAIITTSAAVPQLPIAILDEPENLIPFGLLLS